MMAKKKKQVPTGAEVVQRATGMSKQQAERRAEKLDEKRLQELYGKNDGDSLRALIAGDQDEPAPAKTTTDKKKE